jgi:hypothetical protein
MPDYKVTVEGSEPIPITAPNPASARNHAVRQKVKVEPLTARDAIEFGKKGVDLQTAGEELPEAEPASDAGQGVGDPPPHDPAKK